jgi:guanylate kinase
VSQKEKPVAFLLHKYIELANRVDDPQSTKRRIMERVRAHKLMVIEIAAKTYGIRDEFFAQARRKFDNLAQLRELRDNRKQCLESLETMLQSRLTALEENMAANDDIKDCTFDDERNQTLFRVGTSISSIDDYLIAWKPEAMK